jgi:hypothetical protein
MRSVNRTDDKFGSLHAYPGVCGRAGTDTPIAAPDRYAEFGRGDAAIKSVEIGGFCGKRGVRNRES